MFTMVMSIIALVLSILDLIYFLYFVKLHKYVDLDLKAYNHGNITCTRFYSIASASKARKHGAKLQRI
mgnify:CR=1 FL=1